MECYNQLAQLYDQLVYEDVDYTKWSEIIINNMKEMNIKTDSYLDLACGTGNMMNEVAPIFKKVRGIDLSQDMLCIAEDKMRKIGVNAKFACLDICDFKLKDKFDLITCCLDSTNYILEENDLKRYLKSVYNVLDDNGLFVFDINTEYKLRTILGNNTFTYDNEDIFYVWENSIEDDIVDMYLTFFIRDGELFKRFDENHSERVYSTDFIENTLKEIGLKVIKKLNNYENENIDKECERIAYFIQK